MRMIPVVALTALPSMRGGMDRKYQAADRGPELPLGRLLDRADWAKGAHWLAALKFSTPMPAAGRSSGEGEAAVLSGQGRSGPRSCVASVYCIMARWWQWSNAGLRIEESRVWVLKGHLASSVSWCPAAAVQLSLSSMSDPLNPCS